jgi:hypothetical protein
MSDTSNATKSLSTEAGFFHQIALFSASGLAISMAFIFVGDFQVLYPWF